MAIATTPPAQRTEWQRIARRIRVPLGFVVAALFLLFSHPTGGLLLGSLPLVLAGLALRAYASGYVRKNAELTCTGPYAHTRNPLYLGSALITAGFAVAGGRLWLFLLLAALFSLIYLPTIRSEEAFLRAAFPAFDEYARHVPRLLPRLTPARFPSARDAPSGTGQESLPTPPGRFSRTRYRHHREYNASIGAAAIYAALMLRAVLLR